MTEFTGKYKRVNPESIINDGRDDQVADFFLVLALIYNDFKGLIYFNKLHAESYRAPNHMEVSYHAGEYAGLNLQLRKLVSATIYEFFEFLKQNEEVLRTDEFKLISKQLPSPNRDKWEEIIELVFSQSATDSDFKRQLIRARNNVTFHYYESGKNLRHGFVDFFFKTKKNPTNEYAYYAISDTMSQTRFFYADAAEQQFLNSISNTEEIPTLENFQLAIVDIINAMNETIALLLKVYLRKRTHS